MEEIKSPNELTSEQRNTFKIFVAGSIEMNKAIDWQKDLAEGLKDYNVVLMNPRRDNWDSNWVQSKDNEQFNYQVNWELSHIELADLVIFFYDPNTISPVTLLETGLVLGMNKDVIVCCPKGYFRKGNIDITCERYGKLVVDTMEELLLETKSRLKLNSL